MKESCDFNHDCLQSNVACGCKKISALLTVIGYNSVVYGCKTTSNNTAEVHHITLVLQKAHLEII